MTTGEHDLHTLAGAYVLDAISDDERSAFAGHLAACAQCRQEIVELRETAARLGSATAVSPRPELRAQTLQAAFRTSQLAPVIRKVPEEAPDGSRWRIWRAWRSWAVLPRLAVAAVVVALAGAVGLAAAMHDTMRQLDHSRQQEHLIAAVLSAPDKVMRSAPVTGGGMATVVLSPHEHMGVFTAHRLRPLPPARAYELWLMGPSGDRPAGMITMQHGTMADPAVISGMTAGDMIGLTIEPAGGSARPTSPPLVLIRAGNAARG